MDGLLFTVVFIGLIMYYTRSLQLGQLDYTSGMKKRGKRRIEGSAELGQHLKELRVRRGLTQRDLAGLVEISPAHISAIETGKVTNPGIELVQRIAAALEANVLLGGEIASSTASPTLAYESPFELDADPTGIIQSSLQEIFDILEDQAIPVEERMEIAKQLLSYAQWQRDCTAKGRPAKS